MTTNLVAAMLMATNFFVVDANTSGDFDSCLTIDSQRNVVLHDFDITIHSNAVTVEIVTNQSPPTFEYDTPQWQIPWGTNLFLNVQDAITTTDTIWSHNYGSVKAKTIRFDEVRRKTLRLVWLKKDRTLVDEEILKSWSVRYELKTEERWTETTNAIQKESEITDHVSITNAWALATTNIILNIDTNPTFRFPDEVIDELLLQIEKRKERKEAKP